MNHKIILFLVIVLLLLLILCNRNENFIATPTSQTTTSKSKSSSCTDCTEQIANISSIFNDDKMIVTNLDIMGDMTTKGSITSTGNISTSGNIIGNLSITDVKSGVDGKPIVITSPITYSDNLKPSILALSVGDYKGPVYDASGNTFPIDKYTIKQIQGNNLLGIRNNKWWICPYPVWNQWQYSILEITPIPLNNYYSSYSTHGAITNDVSFAGSDTWNHPAFNHGYVAYDISGNAIPINIYVTPSS